MSYRNISLIFSKKTGFDISCNCLKDNLLEMSNPVFWEKSENTYIINLLSAELGLSGKGKDDMS